MEYSRYMPRCFRVESRGHLTVAILGSSFQDIFSWPSSTDEDGLVRTFVDQADRLWDVDRAMCVFLHVLILALDVSIYLHAQGITPCLLALASSDAEGASSTDRYKRAFSNTCSSFASVVHTVNRIHSFRLFTPAGYFPHHCVHHLSISSARTQPSKITCDKKSVQINRVVTVSNIFDKYLGAKIR